MQVKPRHDARIPKGLVREGTRAAVIAPTLVKPPRDTRGKITHVDQHDFIDEAGAFKYDAIEAFQGDLIHVDAKDGTLTIRRDGQTLVFAPMIQHPTEMPELKKQVGEEVGYGAVLPSQKETVLSPNRPKQRHYGPNRKDRRSLLRLWRKK
jgi:hypothetical protein